MKQQYVIAIISAVFLLACILAYSHKEKFTGATGATTTASAGNLLAVDSTGNLSVTGIADELESLGGTGNTGDVITYNGTAPVWGGIGKNSLTANGYQIFPGGLIIQWGYLSTFGSGVPYNFPIPFPNAVFSFTATPYSGTVDPKNPIYLSVNNVLAGANVTKTSFSFDAGSSMNVYWMAIGN